MFWNRGVPTNRNPTRVSDLGEQQYSADIFQQDVVDYISLNMPVCSCVSHTVYNFNLKLFNLLAQVRVIQSLAYYFLVWYEISTFSSLSIIFFIRNFMLVVGANSCVLIRTFLIMVILWLGWISIMISCSHMKSRGLWIAALTTYGCLVFIFLMHYTIRQRLLNCAVN